MDIRSSQGIALVVTLLAMALLTALVGGLMASSVLGRAVSSNYEEAAELANTADSALELAARELAAIADWNAVLTGAQASTLVDGPPGRRLLAGGVALDLPVLTNELTCGRVTLCTDAQTRLVTLDRPWGANNPRWRLFAHQPFPAVPPMPRPVAPVYIVVWVGDDARETDDDPGVDGAGAGAEGRYVVRARIESFGARGGRHVLEAELARVCTIVAGVEVCLPGVRVLSWRVAS